MREVLTIPGIAHTAPIPMGVKIGDMIFSSAIMGSDPDTQSLPSEPERQAELAFQNMQKLVETAGGTTDDIAHVTVYIKDNSLREHVNSQWLKMFPNENDRPARHAIVLDLPGGMLVQLEVTAVVEEAS